MEKENEKIVIEEQQQFAPVSRTNLVVGKEYYTCPDGTLLKCVAIEPEKGTITFISLDEKWLYHKDENGFILFYYEGDDFYELVKDKSDGE